jgi:hypothetical protein
MAAFHPRLSPAELLFSAIPHFWLMLLILLRAMVLA